ncbi:hypothetical protein HDU76_013032 [Blyttiomyces sp. JEL0837]|nr:hypothetical protein HDU76_013032 [Blyttiomyces sp. JEL0837]
MAIENSTEKPNTDALFKSIKVGRYELKHRVVMAPLTRARGLATREDGEENVPTDIMATYYGQRASEGGLLISEAAPICPEARPGVSIPSIYTDAHVEGWRKVTDAVHAKKGVIFCQLWHVGRNSHSHFDPKGRPPPSSASHPHHLGGNIMTPKGTFPREDSRALTTEEIPELIQQFVDASKRCIEAGFDGVEIHSANGYLLDQFINDNVNVNRTDQYGGSIENRTRLSLEVAKACSEAIGSDRVGIRFSPYGTFGGMGDSTPVQTWSYLIEQLNPLNLAYVHIVEPRIVGGWDSANPVDEKLTLKPFREVYKGTLIVAGGFKPDTGAAAVESGAGDLVAYGRYFISNPDLPNRIKNGVELTPYNRATFYTPGPEGYTDYEECFLSRGLFASTSSSHPIMTSPYSSIALKNRSKVITNLKGKEGAVFLKGLSVATRKWTDTEEVFRQESNFYYMTGVSEPDSHLVLSLSTKEATLLVPRYDEDHALWSGSPPTLAELKAQHGIHKVCFNDELHSVLAEAASASKVVHVLDGEDTSSLQGFNLEAEFLQDALAEARLIKSQEEIEIMRKAGKISGNAHIALMKSTKPGVGTESDLHAIFKYECSKQGAHVQAYTGIIAGGRNGSTLHYVKNNARIPSNPHDLMLIDAACELDCYASDITRCYPVGGKFEGDWKTTYEIVLDVQKACLEAMRPGVLWEDVHRLAEKVMMKGLLKAGLIHGSEEELLKNHIPALFFPHGLGHSIGIDVHDAGGYPKGVERIPEPGIRYLRMRRPLIPGMVVTVEPGCYFVDPILDKAINDPTLVKYLNLDVLQRFRASVGGVRIEDDCAITETGIDNLTGWVPKEIADIEAIMAN